MHKRFHFDKVQFIHFSLLLLVFLVSYENIFAKTNVKEIYSMFPSSCVVSGLMFKFLTHFKKILCVV